MPPVFAFALAYPLVAAPVEEPGPHYGVNHAHIHRVGRGYGSPLSAGELAHLRLLGVTHVALTPFGYQRSADAASLAGYRSRTDVYTPRDRTMTDAHLAAEMDNAHAAGLRVAMKPHIWSNDFWGGHHEWHGTVRQNTPEDHAAWWRAYRAMTLHYARLAQAHGADLFVLGTELVTMTREHPEEWRQLARDVREVFDGELTYAAHWFGEYEQIPFWDELDYIGVNAYFPLDAGPDPDVDAMVEAWRPHVEAIRQIHERFDKPVLLMEVGYRPVADTHLEPWRHGGGVADDDAQAAAYEALFRAFKDEPWMRGYYIWKTFTDPDAGARRLDDTSFSFRKRPAEQVVRRWFTMPVP